MGIRAILSGLVLPLVSRQIKALATSFMTSNGQRPEPLTIAQVEAVALLQVVKWERQRHLLRDDDLDNLMEAPVAYQLLADQAQMFCDLLGRIPDPDAALRQELEVMFERLQIGPEEAFSKFPQSANLVQSSYDE